VADFVHQPMTAIRGGALHLPATTILHSPFCDLQQDLEGFVHSHARDNSIPLFDCASSQMVPGTRELYGKAGGEG
jgi:hypothetical protein